MVGGASPRQGLVEVCVSGVYVPIEDGSFTISEANVICRQLKLGGGKLPIYLIISIISLL